MSSDLSKNSHVKPRRSIACQHLTVGKPTSIATLSVSGALTLYCSNCLIARVELSLKDQHSQPESIAAKVGFAHCSHRFDRTTPAAFCRRCFNGVSNALIKRSSMHYYTDRPRAELLRVVLHRLGKRFKSVAVMNAATQQPSQRQYNPRSKTYQRTVRPASRIVPVPPLFIRTALNFDRGEAAYKTYFAVAKSAILSDFQHKY